MRFHDNVWQLYGVNEYITMLNDNEHQECKALDLASNDYYYWTP
jgi:hypothetical protein